MKTIHIILYIATILLLITMPVSAQQKAIHMGLVSTDSKKALLKRWQPMLKALEHTIGRPVIPEVVGDYAGIIWYLSTNKAQMAWVGNKSAIEAVDRADSEVILQTISLLGLGYYAHLITQKDSPLNSDQDVIDHAGELIFGNGDPNSTSGNLVPGYYVFAKRGIKPATTFKRVLNNNHETNFHDVVAGIVDVATCNSTALARYKSHFPIDYKKIKIIWTSPLIPSDPIVVRRDMAPELKKAITAFFTQYGQPAPGKSAAQLAQEKSILNKRKLLGFHKSDNSQLIPIRKIELYKQKLTLEADQHLPQRIKTERISEINNQLEQLNRQ